MVIVNDEVFCTNEASTMSGVKDVSVLTTGVPVYKVSVTSILPVVHYVYTLALTIIFLLIGKVSS